MRTPDVGKKRSLPHHERKGKGWKRLGFFEIESWKKGRGLTTL